MGVVYSNSSLSKLELALSIALPVVFLAGTVGFIYSASQQPYSYQECLESHKETRLTPVIVGKVTTWTSQNVKVCDKYGGWITVDLSTGTKTHSKEKP